MRVVFFGTPAFAVPTLEAILASRHPVVAVVSQPDRPKGRGHRIELTPTRLVAERHGIPVLQPDKLKDDSFLAALRTLQPDIGVVAAYGRILPAGLLELPPRGMVNVHASLLPAYRGAAPIQRAVMAGETETGITIMRVVPELDAGPMLDAARIPIGENETAVEVSAALATLGAGRLAAVLDRIAAGASTESPQDDARATYAPKITREEGAIEWSLPARMLHNRVRGLQPWPLVAAQIAGERCLLHRTSVDPHASGAAPGTVLAAGGDGIVVATGDGGLRILSLQPAGRRVMSAREFLAGRSVPRGPVAGHS